MRAWVRYDSNGRIVPGSNIFSPERPKNGDWEEISVYYAPTLYYPNQIRAWIRYDREGKMIPSSLLLRNTMPKIGKWNSLFPFNCCIPEITTTSSTTTILATTTTTTTLPATTTTTTTAEIRILYGLLYNSYAAMDAREIANTGFHVPTKTEYDTLATFLGGAAVAGGKLKETGTTHWKSPNTGASNSSLFYGRGSGARYSGSGTFSTDHSIFRGWTSTPHGVIPNSYHVLSLGNGDATSSTTGFGGYTQGSSIRLIKDSTLLNDGESGTYTGNDGRVYYTICIGTQEWLAENLAETKYRNNEDIPEVTDNATWAGLTSGALCALSNDWNNV